MSADHRPRSPCFGDAIDVRHPRADARREFRHSLENFKAIAEGRPADKVYLDAVAGAFGAEIDYAIACQDLRRVRGAGTGAEYSPAECHGAINTPITGKPDKRDISTSHVERHNLTMRMAMKRFGRLTNAFSKKVDNHIHALSLYFVFYNFVRTHKAHKLSPAMAAGVADKLWSMKDVAALVEARAAKPGKRGPYKLREVRA